MNMDTYNGNTMYTCRNKIIGHAKNCLRQHTQPDPSLRLLNSCRSPFQLVLTLSISKHDQKTGQKLWLAYTCVSLIYYLIILKT